MLKTALVFGDNMVLQRHKEIKIWGTGEPKRQVKGLLTSPAHFINEGQITSQTQAENVSEVVTVIEQVGTWMMSGWYLW